MIVSIHQPHYMPWLRYFSKIAHSDYFVLYDDVQYQKNGWIHRTRIRENNDFLLTIPVHNNSHSLITQVITVNDYWKKKHVKSIEMAYHNCPFFSLYYDSIAETIYGSGDNLAEINISIIKLFLKILEINVKIFRSSDLISKSNKTKRLVNICKELDCDTYLSGLYAINSYIDLEEFKKERIKLMWSDFKCYPYAQSIYNDFIPDLSIVDLLMNHPITFCKEYIYNGELKEVCL